MSGQSSEKKPTLLDAVVNKGVDKTAEVAADSIVQSVEENAEKVLADQEGKLKNYLLKLLLGQGLFYFFWEHGQKKKELNLKKDAFHKGLKALATELGKDQKHALEAIEARMNRSQIDLEASVNSNERKDKLSRDIKKYEASLGKYYALKDEHEALKEHEQNYRKNRWTMLKNAVFRMAVILVLSVAYFYLGGIILPLVAPALSLVINIVMPFLVIIGGLRLVYNFFRGKAAEKESKVEDKIDPDKSAEETMDNFLEKDKSKSPIIKALNKLYEKAKCAFDESSENTEKAKNPMPVWSNEAETNARLDYFIMPSNLKSLAECQEMRAVVNKIKSSLKTNVAFYKPKHTKMDLKKMGDIFKNHLEQAKIENEKDSLSNPHLEKYYDKLLAIEESLKNKKSPEKKETFFREFLLLGHAYHQLLITDDKKLWALPVSEKFAASLYEVLGVSEQEYGKYQEYLKARSNWVRSLDVNARNELHHDPETLIEEIKEFGEKSVDVVKNAAEDLVGIAHENKKIETYASKKRIIEEASKQMTANDATDVFGKNSGAEFNTEKKLETQFRDLKLKALSLNEVERYKVEIATHECTRVKKDKLSQKKVDLSLTDKELESISTYLNIIYDEDYQAGKALLQLQEEFNIFKESAEFVLEDLDSKIDTLLSEEKQSFGSILDAYQSKNEKSVSDDIIKLIALIPERDFSKYKVLNQAEKMLGKFLPKVFDAFFNENEEKFRNLSESKDQLKELAENFKQLINHFDLESDKPVDTASASQCVKNILKVMKNKDLLSPDKLPNKFDTQAEGSTEKKLSQAEIKVGEEALFKLEQDLLLKQAQFKSEKITKLIEEINKNLTLLSEDEEGFSSSKSEKPFSKAGKISLWNKCMSDYANLDILCYKAQISPHIYMIHKISESLFFSSSNSENFSKSCLSSSVFFPKH